MTFPKSTPRWFDAHLDLAYLTECGRDMHAGLRACRGPSQPAAITLPSLKDGNVQACLGTIFTCPAGQLQADRGPFEYSEGDLDGAHRAGVRQLKLYQAWHAGSAIRLVGPNAPSPVPEPASEDAMRLGILMECADPIRDPTEVGWWFEQGVIAVGMAWATQSRYAGGNRTTTGLTDLGRALVIAMDDVGIMHDASHLSQRAIDDLFQATDARVVATHSNCRALLDGKDERHLSDDAIREIARRGGVIGLNLFVRFLSVSGGKKGATIDDCVAHVEHVCELTGTRSAVGLGSDADGGFDATCLPEGIREPAHYAKLTDALASRGWSEEDLDGFRWGNWSRALADAGTNIES